MRDVEHGSIHPYVLVLKGTANSYKWNILRPDGTLYECSSKAMAWKIAKSWSKKFKASQSLNRKLFSVDGWFEPPINN